MGTTNITEIKNLVRPDILSCPEPIINREVVSAILDFCKKTNVFQREFQLDVDENDIDTDIQNCIDFDIAEFSRDLRPVTVLDIVIDGEPYVPYKRNIRNTLTYFDSIPGGAGASVGADERFKYFWLPDNHTIRVFDMLSSMTKIYFRISVKPLRTATTIDTDLFEDWSEALIAGAKMNLLMMPGKEWTDLTAAAIYKREYRKYLSQAKQQQVAGGSRVHQEQVKWKSFGE